MVSTRSWWPPPPACIPGSVCWPTWVRYMSSLLGAAGHVANVVGGEVEDGAGVCANFGRTPVYDTLGGAAQSSILGWDAPRSAMLLSQSGPHAATAIVAMLSGRTSPSRARTSASCCLPLADAPASARVARRFMHNETTARSAPHAKVWPAEPCLDSTQLGADAQYLAGSKVIFI